MSQKASQSFWEKPKCVLDVDSDGPSILTITLIRKEEGFGNWLPFVDAEGPIPAEIASLRHPLSSTDGSKKWKLHLDMQGFAPDNVYISIVEKNAAPTLKIEMRRMVDGANYAYFRKIDIPPGVKLSRVPVSAAQPNVTSSQPVVVAQAPANTYIQPSVAQPAQQSVAYIPAVAQSSYAYPPTHQQPVWNPQMQAYTYPTYANPQQTSYPVPQHPVWNPQMQGYTYPTSYVYPSVQQPVINGYPNTQQQLIYTPQTQSYTYPTVQQPVNQIQGYSKPNYYTGGQTQQPVATYGPAQPTNIYGYAPATNGYVNLNQAAAPVVTG
uniref:Uncharacterized protein n=1 Tax=Ditylenchus dipsaci TaxID=166011 RepID=A0A915ECG9_9BILA